VGGEAVAIWVFEGPTGGIRERVIFQRGGLRGKNGVQQPGRKRKVLRAKNHEKGAARQRGKERQARRLGETPDRAQNGVREKRLGGEKRKSLPL